MYVLYTNICTHLHDRFRCGLLLLLLLLLMVDIEGGDLVRENIGDIIGRTLDFFRRDLQLDSMNKN